MCDALKEFRLLWTDSNEKRMLSKGDIQMTRFLQNFDRSCFLKGAKNTILYTKEEEKLITRFPADKTQVTKLSLVRIDYL